MGHRLNDYVYIDWGVPDDRGTILNLLGGGIVKEYVHAWSGSRVNILGGWIEGKLQADHRTVTRISAGGTGGDVLLTGTLIMSGGSIGSDLRANAASQVEICNGTIKEHIVAYDTSQITISGGTVGSSLYAYKSSQVSMVGGAIGGDVVLDDSAILTLEGSSFTVDGIAYKSAEFTSVLGGYWADEPQRHVLGRLLNGDTMDNDFYIGHSARIVLVPEPATLLLLGLGAVMARRRLCAS